MKKIGFLIALFLFGFGALHAQSRPDWMDEDIRSMQYPSSEYLIGFASGNMLSGENEMQATERVRNAAQANLLENIKVNMKSSTSSAIFAESVNGQYTESEQFVNTTSKSSIAEIVGMKTDTYYDKKSKTVYAFARAKRSEVVDYHVKLLQYNLSRVDGLLTTARNLSAQNDRASARTKCAEALSLFPKISESQGLLIAIGGSGNGEVQQERAKGLYDNVLGLQSQLDPKFEIVENLRGELAQRLMLVESLLKTAKDLVNDGEKSKARQQCELAQGTLSEARQTQETIRQTDPSVSLDVLMQHRVESFDNEVKVMLAQLAQAVLVYIESTENLFGKQVNVVASKLKSQLASNGCSFTDDAAKADFKLMLSSDVREGSVNGNLVFCYADVSIDLYDNHKQKSVYSDDISEKGGSTTKEKAARKAMENAAGKIMTGIEPWVK